ncbi:hypothetical protein C8N35_1011334 [Breoghania corrubedonensis]|uniref:DUF2474 family protein n=1 Tax=Breoghania corrubedonensis TaxID=665038 RepID=A0A2T5VHQ9_9HYPH|nr:hypothetical protein [Breoghania corrubedonensis]PTW63283.1 hypothetical protein C8N35_1011334 [Breoghania corrubedonensis]
MMTFHEKYAYSLMHTRPSKPLPKRRFRFWSPRLSWIAGLWAAGGLTVAAVTFLVRSWFGN